MSCMTITITLDAGKWYGGEGPTDAVCHKNKSPC